MAAAKSTGWRMLRHQYGASSAGPSMSEPVTSETSGIAVSPGRTSRTASMNSSWIGSIQRLW